MGLSQKDLALVCRAYHLILYRSPVSPIGQGNMSIEAHMPLPLLYRDLRLGPQNSLLKPPQAHLMSLSKLLPWVH